MSSTSAAVDQRNQDATCYVGGLDDAADEELLWELFVQVGPVVSVFMPKDKVTGAHQGFAFVEFRTEDDADYAVKVLNMLKLYGKLLRVSKAAADKAKGVDNVGANLFIGNLDPEVDEKVLYDTFSAFGHIIQPPKVSRDPDTGAARGFGFVSYDSFEASDLAIECMNGKFLANRQVVVQYAFRKDSRTERHGSAAERLLAAAARKGTSGPKPHMLFADAAGNVVSTRPPAPADGVPGGPPTGGGMVGMSYHTRGMVAPPMLPPTAILPATMAPPPLPSTTTTSLPMPPPATTTGTATTGSLLPPPLPLPMPMPPASMPTMPPYGHGGMPMPGMAAMYPPAMPGMGLMGMPGRMGMGMPPPGGFPPPMPPPFGMMPPPAGRPS